MSGTATQEKIYRGIRLRLPAQVHAVVHDEARPVAERAATLADYLASKPLGWHWSSKPEGALQFATGKNFWASFSMPDADDVTAVYLVARHPGDRAVMGEAEALKDDASACASPTDYEVPVREGWPLEVLQMQWMLSTAKGVKAAGSFLKPRKWEA